MKLKTRSLAALAALTLAGPTSAATLLFSDNFNDNPNEQASTFNNNLASTQSGSIGVTTYTIGSGTGNAVQHSNSSELLVANFSGANVGKVSLDNNFATQANSLNQALVFSFQLKAVSGFAEGDNWASFTVGSTQNPFITDGNAGMLFRQNGQTESWVGGANAAGPSWSVNDYVTITLSGTGGVGSAFNGNGSVANIKVGATNVGTWTLAQQTVAYLTFALAGPNDGNTSIGKFDNLSVTAVPEPSAALLGGLGVLALLRRRR
jgi:hypothetical protein